MKHPKPRLEPTPLPTTDEGWDRLAAEQGIESGALLKEQCRIADEIIDEILAEAAAKKAQSKATPLTISGCFGTDEDEES